MPGERRRERGRVGGALRGARTECLKPSSSAGHASQATPSVTGRPQSATARRAKVRGSKECKVRGRVSKRGKAREGEGVHERFACCIAILSGACRRAVNIFERRGRRRKKHTNVFLDIVPPPWERLQCLLHSQAA